MVEDTIRYEKSPWTEGEDVAIPLIDTFGRYCHFSGKASYDALPLERGVKIIMSHPAQKELLSVGMFHANFPVYTPLGSFPQQSVYRTLTGKEILSQREEDESDDSLIASASELANVLSDINSLAFQEESDEFGLLRPSFHALRECLKCVISLVREAELLRPSEISTDRNGDIRIAWRGENKEAELVFPSDESAAFYLYHSSPDSYGTEPDLSPRSIERRIRWAVDGQ